MALAEELPTFSLGSRTIPGYNEQTQWRQKQRRTNRHGDADNPEEQTTREEDKYEVEENETTKYIK